MTEHKRVNPEALYRRCDQEEWRFETTAELEPLVGTVGQERAREALDFGVNVTAQGYNLFAMGSSNLGKVRVVEERLKEAALKRSVRCDWCYVHNFEEPQRPEYLCLPPGRGRELQQAMKKLIDEFREVIPSAMRAEDFQTSQQTIEENFRQRQEEALESVREKASRYDIAVIRTPTGVVMAPMEDEEVVPPDRFQERPREERDRFEERLESLHRELARTMNQVPDWEQKRKQQIEELEKETVRAVIAGRLQRLRDRFAGLDDVHRFLIAVEEDVVEQRRRFFGHGASGMDPDWEQMMQIPGMGGREPEWNRRYEVNVLTHDGEDRVAPVIREHHPTLENLVGRIDHEARMGALTTDQTMIRPGALHRANGGYLILDARDVLRQPMGWEQLKRTLRSGEIRIETAAQILGVLSTVTLEPEPIPLDIKVVLVGDRVVYELLQKLDPDFEDLFKVAVDFEEDTSRFNSKVENGEIGEFVRLLATMIGEAGLRPFERGAVARVVEEASRMAGDSRRVSLHVRALEDVLCEADYFAGRQERELVSVADVRRALDARRKRRSRLNERRIDAIVRRELAVSIDGEVIGQVNGLSVAEQAGWRFGMPSRITATVRMGTGEVLDIEREVDMGGPIHSKGVLILAGYLGATFGVSRPLALSAGLVFEQTYGGVDGDSASLAELIALLSALAGHPVRQELGITGSIDQRGKVQAVGAINEKIEGFFDVCTRMGRTGTQGVVIPGTNREHLMLRRDVVEAAEAEEFSIYTVDTIEEATNLLTGLPAGEPDKNGAYDRQTFFGMVEARLDEFAEARRAWNGAGKK